MKRFAPGFLLALATAGCSADAAEPPPPRYLASFDTLPGVGIDDSATAESIVAVTDSVGPASPLVDRCDPNYSPCVPIDSDVDCAGGRGNGPSYVRGPVEVVGTDVYGLDGNDDDGKGCER